MRSTSLPEHYANERTACVYQDIRWCRKRIFLYEVYLCHQKQAYYSKGSLFQPMIRSLREALLKWPPPWQIHLGLLPCSSFFKLFSHSS
uniref:Uncharacterized protein n=1 Tax=Anguilla anguilla TaxID=7936 RepID=A0A0E9X6F1_ANGAN